MAVTIRPATVDDAAAIAEVHVSSWRWAYRGLVEQAHLDALSVDARAKTWRECFSRRDERSLLLVADVGGVVGFIEAGTADGEEPSCGEVHAIYLDEAHAGTGVGRALLDAATEHLRGAGFLRAILWTLEGNDRAIRFYERAGWALDGAVDTYEIGGRATTIRRLSRDL